MQGLTSADDLLKSRTIPELRKLVYTLSSDADGKQSELRSMVRSLRRLLDNYFLLFRTLFYFYFYCDHPSSLSQSSSSTLSSHYHHRFSFPIFCFLVCNNIHILFWYFDSSPIHPRMCERMGFVCLCFFFPLRLYLCLLHSTGWLEVSRLHTERRCN